MAQVIAECARKRVRGLVVMSGGFSEEGPAGLAAERALVATARANGMRVIGPNCLGIMNTAPDVRLNATLADGPRRRAGGPGSSPSPVPSASPRSSRSTGAAIGLSTFVSAGNRADVSGNDLLQYWEDDPATDVVLLHLESFGNARKFARLARRLGRRKPIVAVKSGGCGGTPAGRLGGSGSGRRRAVPPGRRGPRRHARPAPRRRPGARHPAASRRAPGRGRGQLGRAWPAGRDACAGSGLEVGPLVAGHARGAARRAGTGCGHRQPAGAARWLRPGEFAWRACRGARRPRRRRGRHRLRPGTARARVAGDRRRAPRRPGRARKPVVSTFLGFGGAGREQRAGLRCSPPRRLPWRRWAEPRPTPSGGAGPRARCQPSRASTRTAPAKHVEDALRDSPQGGTLPADQVNRLLAAYGVRVWPAVVVSVSGRGGGGGRSSSVTRSR